jgi:hypothetical protein
MDRKIGKKSILDYKAEGEVGGDGEGSATWPMSETPMVVGGSTMVGETWDMGYTFQRILRMEDSGVIGDNDVDH